MRTYDDTFSGEKIYPGKVGIPDSSRRKFGGERYLKKWHTGAEDLKGRMEC